MNQKLILLIVFFALTGNVFAQTYDSGCIRDYGCLTLPVIEFKNTVFLSKKAKLQLDSVVKNAKQYPTCRIWVIGYGTSSEESQQHSWDKVASVIIYLKKKGMPKERLMFYHGEEGKTDTVNLVGTTLFTDVPSWTPPPHPQFSLHTRKVTDFYSN